MTVISDRDRIARDLHDTVIQRLFAIGLSLQGSIRLVEDDQLRDRLQDSLDEIDRTILQVRTTIFELGDRDAASEGVRSRVLALVGEARRGLGFDPEVRFAGPLDSLVDADLVTHLLAVLRESLSNIARHAKARSAWVDVLIKSGELQLVVTDDGKGIDRQGIDPGNGITNMGQRAQALRGSCSIAARPDGGTEVRWCVPL